MATYHADTRKRMADMGLNESVDIILSDGLWTSGFNCHQAYYFVRDLNNPNNPYDSINKSIMAKGVK